MKPSLSGFLLPPDLPLRTGFYCKLMDLLHAASVAYELFKKKCNYLGTSQVIFPYTEKLDFKPLITIINTFIKDYSAFVNEDTSHSIVYYPITIYSHAGPGTELFYPVQSQQHDP